MQWNDGAEPHGRWGGREALVSTPPSAPAASSLAKGASNNLHLWDKHLPRGPCLKRMLRECKPSTGCRGPCSTGTRGYGPHQAKRPPTRSEAGPSQGHLCLLGAGRVAQEWGRLTSSSLHQGVKAINKSTVKIKSLKANELCVNSLQPPLGDRLGGDAAF